MANKVTETRDIPRGLKGQVTKLARLRREYETHLAEKDDVRDEITRLEKRVKEGAVDHEQGAESILELVRKRSTCGS